MELLDIDISYNAARPVYGQLIDEVCLLEGKHLVLPSHALSDSFTIKTTVKISPIQNTRLFGLYHSDGLLVTQNEAEGFRSITYSQDRPDVLSHFTVTLTADKVEFPVLLSNGDVVGNVDYGSRHSVTFIDPHPKPSYLFALVAGKLEKISVPFVVGRSCLEAVAAFYNIDYSRAVKEDIAVKYCPIPREPVIPRVVHLYVWGKSGTTERLVWALKSIEKAMLWDEIVYGRFYDLDVFHVVAVRDFNAGAMENKGLNIFNIALVEADPDISTDSQFMRIQGVIAHEYFHNWSGDRVTLRDWFQLTLKEGFTVLRDQQFTHDISKSVAKRIDDAKFMQDVQYKEDAGPLRHPIRPESYMSIENFYTVTVYEKGAEVVRMYQTIMGWEKFRHGTDLYFRRNDGRAVTCEDFHDAMQQTVPEIELGPFFRWYNTSGTPRLSVLSRRWDPVHLTYQITLTQTLPQPGPPLLIPIVLGFLSKKRPVDAAPTEVLKMYDLSQTFTVKNITEDMIPTINRGYSAPILVDDYLSSDELLHQAKYDSCTYIRWHSTQEIYSKAVKAQINGYRAKETFQSVSDIVSSLLNDVKPGGGDLKDLKAMAFKLTFPAITSYMSDKVMTFDPLAIYKATEAVKLTLVQQLGSQLQETVNFLADLLAGQPYELTTDQIGIRALKNSILSLMSADKQNLTTLQLAVTQLQDALSEDDAANALYIITNYPPSETRDQALAYYYTTRALFDDLLLDRWISAQAASKAVDAPKRVLDIANADYYRFSQTPNRIRALLSTLTHNLVLFNTPDGSMYKFVADEILRIDAFNPKVAARIATAFTDWNRLPHNLRTLIKEQIERMLHTPGLSTQTLEIIEKAASSK